MTTNLSGKRAKCWTKCREKIAQAENALKTDHPTANSNERLRAAMEALQGMLNPEEPFTAVVRECLNTSGHHWAQQTANHG
jgi:hypothetical protein